MKPSIFPANDAKPGQAGFALPLALIAIALLSIITLAGYRAVTGATVIATALQENARVEQALYSAESETAFVFLTNAAAPGGLLTDTDVAGVDDILGSTPEIETLTPEQYWQANGEQRQNAGFSPKVTVAYFDSAGFPPFDLLSETALAQFLGGAGFDDDAAIRFAAIIGDYQDNDTQRRFRGAERSDYRLYGMAPPSNSPLRTTGELASVLGFRDEAPFSSWDFIMMNARFGGLSSEYKPKLGPQPLAEILADESESLTPQDPLGLVAADDIQPTDTARFLLAVQTENGLTRRRAVEIMRTVGAADKPFRRIWIYDKVDDDDFAATQAREQDGLAPIFEPAPSADPG